MKSDVVEINRKLAALEIIFGAPVWPQRDRLSPSGQALYDILIDRAKPYALAVVDEDFTGAFHILAECSPLVSQFVDATMILDDDPDIAEANRRLLAVFLYYCRAIGVDFSVIEKGLQRPD